MDKSRLHPKDLAFLVTPDSKDNELKAATSAVPWLRDSEVVSTVRGTAGGRKDQLLLILIDLGPLLAMKLKLENY